MANTKITPHVLDGTLISGHSTVTAADGDFVLIQDISDSNALKKALVSDFAKNTTEEIQDIVGAMFTSNTETNITATYQDGDGTIDLVVAASSSAADDISTGDAAVTIGTSSGAITLDTPSSITLDSDTGVIDFDDGGTNIGRFENSSSDFKMEARVQDKDIVFVGNDGGTGIDMLRLDASDAGTAAFNKNIKVGDGNTLVFGGGDDLELYHIADSINVIRGAPGLVLQTDDTSYGIQMGTYSGGETMFKALKNGGVTLYNDNEEKLGTNDKGIVVASTGSKDVTIGMSNGDMDWHIGIDDSAGDLFRIGKHTGMGNNCVYSVTPAYKHRFEGAHQGDSVGTWVFDNENLGDGSTTNCTLMVKNGNAQIQIMPWSSLGARIGTRGGGWSSNSNNAVHLTSNDAGNIILNTNGSPTLANGTAISSDERLKKNITDISSGQLAKINALTPRNFEWKDSRKSGAQEGFIAQEVAAVIPEAVEDRLCSPDPDDTSRDFEGDVKVLKHEVINARLIKAVQELSAKLEAAEARITTLEG